jgi:hypothetical protein
MALPPFSGAGEKTTLAVVTDDLLEGHAGADAVVRMARPLGKRGGRPIWRWRG